MNIIIPNHRIKLDVLRLMSHNFEVTSIPPNNYTNLNVVFHGPKETPYEGGVWNVRVHIPYTYPFKSPSVGFNTQIFHPNIDQTSGTICLDVLNQKWTALYDLVVIFDTFLPQLLRHPNPEDPLNPCAAMVLIRTPERYNHVVTRHVQEFANPERGIGEGWGEMQQQQQQQQKRPHSDSEHEESTDVSDLSDSD